MRLGWLRGWWLKAMEQSLRLRLRLAFGRWGLLAAVLDARS